jgi:hypothetical protein
LDLLNRYLLRVAGGHFAFASVNGIIAAVKNNGHEMSLSKNKRVGKSAFFSLLLFSVVILAPQGIGIRPWTGWPQIDVTRVAILSTLFWGLMLGAKGRWKDFFCKAPVSSVVFLFMAAWFVLTAALSAQRSFSFFVVARHLALGPLYALAFSFLAEPKDPSYERTFFFFSFLVTSLLVLMASVEFVFQCQLISPAWRTGFNSESLRSAVELVYMRGGLSLSEGPYVSNHTLGGMLCVFSGFVLGALEEKKRGGILLCVLFFMALYAAGTRAATVAVLASFTGWLILRRSIIVFLRLIICLACAAIAVVIRVVVSEGRLNYFYTVDLRGASVSGFEKSLFTFPHFAGKEFIWHFLSSYGTFGVRAMGLLQNLAQVKEWWLFGYSPGSFFMANQVHSSGFQYSDPGLFFALMFESGLPILFLCIFLLFFSLTIISRKTESKAWMPALGVVSWTIFSLSSQDLWPMLPALVMVVAAEMFTRCSSSPQVMRTSRSVDEYESS